MTEQLTVFFNEKEIGILTLASGKLSFKYLEDYVKSQDNHPLSLSLPLQNEAFSHEVTSAYFSGLLPDEPLRSRLAKYLHISSKNTFALLKAIGGECAGAISFYPFGKNINQNAQYEYRVLNDIEANNLLQTLHRHPLLAGDEGIRLSQAGAQDKLMIAFVENQVAIPIENTPSTHIIKPAIKDLKDTVFNELFCMRLAAACGLDTAKADILWIEKTPYYLVERYDRVSSDNHIIRLHQEDFCQALHIPPEIKYENEGGPSLITCFELLDNQIKSGKLLAKEKIEFFKTIIFNFLIGNGDAHGKNFSLLYQHNSEKLTPRYDLLSTVVYDNPKKAKMAMKIASKYKFQDVQLRHFLKLAESVGFRDKFVLTSVIQPIAKNILDQSISLAEQFNNDEKYKSEIYQDIILIIEKHQKRLMNSM
ncbi:type II toxin-antitoxin system HipA family toxin [Thiotrichales bacterium 19X7-9]|nr:type II toxin-antitoxin system HipA family toxin [Thiotrichales bacterium 19X7-9]